MGDTENGLRNVPWTDPAMTPPGPSGDVGTGGYTPDAPGPNGIQNSPWGNPPVPVPSGAGTPTPELGLPGPTTMSIEGLSEGASFDKDITSWSNTVDKR